MYTTQLFMWQFPKLRPLPLTFSHHTGSHFYQNRSPHSSHALCCQRGFSVLQEISLSMCCKTFFYIFCVAPSHRSPTLTAPLHCKTRKLLDMIPTSNSEPLHHSFSFPSALFLFGLRRTLPYTYQGLQNTATLTICHNDARHTAAKTSGLKKWVEYRPCRKELVLIYYFKYMIAHCKI